MKKNLKLPTLNEIKEPVKQELQSFESYFKNTMKTKVPLLSIITNYIYRRKGKQLRPLLVFLTAGMTGKICQSTYVAAGMIELLHTATLIHDDVVDEAYERRGSYSINALWRSKVAVLVGDFLLSKGLLLAIETNEFDLLRNMSNAVKEMSEGELLQIERSLRMDIDENTYFDIIRKKTATLISSCTANGATSSGASPETIELMREMGLYLGIAFQLKDDIFDYRAKGFLGKPIGNDIKEKKLTLPLIFALNRAEKSVQKEVLRWVRKGKHDQKSVNQVIEFVIAAKGIEYAESKMLEYRQKAKNILAQFSETPYRSSLELLSDFITDRNN